MNKLFQCQGTSLSLFFCRCIFTFTIFYAWIDVDDEDFKSNRNGTCSRNLAITIYLRIIEKKGKFQKQNKTKKTCENHIDKQTNLTNNQHTPW